MRRIFLTDGSNKWFDADKANLVNEETFHDGRSWISKATGTHSEHEALYITKSGRFIKNEWSNWQGKTDNYNEIERDEAVMWIAKNGHEQLAASFDHDDILGSEEL